MQTLGETLQTKWSGYNFSHNTETLKFKSDIFRKKWADKHRRNTKLSSLLPHPRVFLKNKQTEE